MPCMATDIPNFIFVKTHKTGSSTISNILHNMVLRHNLKVVPINETRGREGYQYSCRALQKLEDAGYPMKSNIWANHFGYAPGEMEHNDCLAKYVPGGNHLTILRHPVDRTISHVYYFFKAQLKEFNCSFSQFFTAAAEQCNRQCKQLGVLVNDELSEQQDADIARVVENFDILFLEDLANSTHWRWKYQLPWAGISLHSMKTGFSKGPVRNEREPRAALRCQKPETPNWPGKHLRKMIERCNSCDMKLYQSAWRRWLQIKMSTKWPMLEPASLRNDCEDPASDICLFSTLDNVAWIRRFNKKYGFK